MNEPLRPYQAGYRICLKCNKTFLSKGAGNRICKGCRKINASLGPISESQIAMQRGAKRLNGIPIDIPNSYESSFSSFNPYIF